MLLFNVEHLWGGKRLYIQCEIESRSRRCISRDFMRPLRTSLFENRSTYFVSSIENDSESRKLKNFSFFQSQKMHISKAIKIKFSYPYNLDIYFLTRSLLRTFAIICNENNVAKTFSTCDIKSSSTVEFFI